MAKLEDKCPACGHILMWSAGRRGRRTLLNRLLRRKSRAYFWECSVGLGDDWPVEFCGCRHGAHNLVMSLGPS